jgi:predicted RNA binding protein YcfA (HicA-like mRNA interferase family)
MSKPPLITAREAIKAFEKIGYKFDRQGGTSHSIYVKEGAPFILVIPVHKGEKLALGTLRSLIKAAGLTVEEFRELL